MIQLCGIGIKLPLQAVPIISMLPVLKDLTTQSVLAKIFLEHVIHHYSGFAIVMLSVRCLKLEMIPSLVNISMPIIAIP